ncbi:DNA-binding IclR family transcriptional regulator [Sphingomonas vulcanisoli]|uniref:DNA-binding IclR family transcriptional regulator n=1 Tax=Sphingomonas vulcanisoli TaxID=1658060 RepID=A0ABX0TUZ2_9SPHN|nr:DNA-binding IclR family transcriptional regulator [Sphingomonas vulcanisoli]
MSECDGQGSDRRGIQSIEIGLRVIDALRTSPGPLSLKALAAAADLPISNCHRYCVSFVRSGYMQQHTPSGRYDLGPRLLQAGLAALARIDAVAIATEALEALVDETGSTGQLAVWGDRGPTVIRWIAGRAAVRASITVGAVLPLLTSATGRVFLGFLPRRQTAALAAHEAMAGGGDPDALAAQVSALGTGHVSNDHIPGLSAVAAPILDAFGEAAAVVTLVGAREGIAQHAVERLRVAAATASARLGWQPPEAIAS